MASSTPPPGGWSAPSSPPSAPRPPCRRSAKYSPGGCRVLVEDRASDNQVSISVRDHGLGIPQGELGKLSDRFFRASTSVGIRGTGIGLNLTQLLVELHGGTIEVASTEGEGSTFTVTFPAGQPGLDQGAYATLKAGEAA